MMSEIIPKHILNAPKQGFSSPDASWFRGESIDFVRNRLKDKQSIIYKYLDFKSVNELVDEHISGSKNRRLLIWSLLNLEQWIGKNL